MESAVYRICFPDIFDHVVSFLEVQDVTALALTNTHFARFVKDAGLLYRHISLSFDQTTSSQFAASDERILKFHSCLRISPSNAASIASLSIRHRFSGFLPTEEISYVDLIVSLTNLCPNVESLSLHLSRWSSSVYACSPTPREPFDKGATRPFFCRAFYDSRDSVQNGLRVIDDILGGLTKLRALDWCVECRPSGMLSQDWKVSHLREELEMIDRACPNLERLGLLNYHDSRVVDAVVHEVDTDGAEWFLVDGESAIGGLFPKLQEVTFHVKAERDLDKILSAAVMGLTLGRTRKAISKIVPWQQENASQTLVLDDIGKILHFQELAYKQLDMPPEEFLSLLSHYLHFDGVFEISVFSRDYFQLEYLHYLSQSLNSVNVILNVHELSRLEVEALVLPPNTKSL